MKKTVLILVALFFVGCFLQGPAGPQGDNGPGTLWQNTGVLYSNMYDTLPTGVKCWNISYYGSDTADVQCVVRIGGGYLWIEPDVWAYDKYEIRIMDATKEYANYEYKITMITP